MRPYAKRPIDPEFVRANMGRPRAVREFMLRASGSRVRSDVHFDRQPPGEWVYASDATDASLTVLYLHGGGFLACSPQTHRPLVGSLMTRLHARAFVPQYRLAPEHPFPAAADDALDAYRFLVRQVGVHPSRIIIAGDSAGGGLALTTAQSLRAHDLPQPAAIIMYSPWTDLASTGASLEENSDKCSMFAAVTIRRAAAIYLGTAAATDPRASPLYGDFAGLPPMLVHASEDEVLRDDSARVAARARAAGVDVSFRLWKGVPHCWQFFAAAMPEAIESLAITTEFVQQHVSVRGDDLR
ncbi:MAG: alpha/beta hydrolase [Gemmatimonadota bacterium]|nr:alpha/beta hydrolase [Gemmatimonadota bacterium]